ncbi:ATP-binding protein [Actinacidiphila glaucinigra]|uniref:ATP-binding protein n=1 Tax=Actinacidiphila glaucinigra TaxID=235986 RepID=UPI0029B47FE0|nr:ATP-binding protein [Actinacidiphila glaucinigra]MDX2853566.1 ATP-binding protein [Streptomyces sp. PA03-3a]WSD60956.1 ATP-binding protein [Actinacidiphila glaucinigra]
MPTVELLFSALPEHVRTARLVAAAVARRAGVDEAVLDEVRLAVGEACSRAVGLYRSSGADRPVRVVLTEEEKKFSIEVGDKSPEAEDRPADAASVPSARGDSPAEHPEPLPDGSPSSSDSSEAEDEGQMGLAVISGLVDDVEVFSGEYGDVIRMSWPLNPAALS